MKGAENQRKGKNMTVGNVSFGTQEQINQQPKSSGLLKGTAISAGVGAVAAGGMEYLRQRNIIKHPDDVVKSHRKIYSSYIKYIKEKFGDKANIKEAIHNLYKDAFEDIKKIRAFAKAGKISYKGLGKAAAIGASITGGIYLAYRGVKALFSSKS